MNISLSNNQGYPWYSLDNVYVKGYAFDCTGQYLVDSGFAKFFEGISSPDEFKDKISRLNGVFSVVLNLSNSVCLAVDINRTFPLFYTKQNQDWVISDDANYLQEKYDLELCSLAKEEFKHAGYVIGNKTLLKNLYQTQAAEVVELTAGEPEGSEYWTYAAEKVTEKSISLLQSELLIIYENIAGRLITAAQGNTIVIPLSGGYDSRLVLALLVKSGYKNIQCFTYGSKTSFEVRVAKKVAKKLNVKLEIIDYSNDFIDEYFDGDEFNKYLIYGAGFVSLSHFQDFLAVKYLKVNKIIPDDSLIAPGHSGDIFAGTHIARSINMTSTALDVEREVCNKHFLLNGGCSFEIEYYKDKSYAYSNLEAWSWKERQAKFIVNSLRVYEFFGYKSALPLWDKELASYFKLVPLEYKNRNSYVKYSKDTNAYDGSINTIFSELDIVFDAGKFNFLQRIIRRIKSSLFGEIEDLNNFEYFFSKFMTEDFNKGGFCLNSKVVNYLLYMLSKDLRESAKHD